MSTRIRARASFRFALLAACLGLTGTAYAAGGSQQQPSDGGTSPPAAPEQPPPSVSLAGSTRHVARGARVRFRGAVRPVAAGRHVRLQVRRSRGWRTVARARVRSSGRFSAWWRPLAPGRFRVRVNMHERSARAAAASRTLRGRVYVYRPALASWYGPGFYGSRTACGGRMSPWRLGVANKSLACGTRVTLRYRRRSITVPVIDRGPYAGAREFDLTAATKRRLGFGSTGTVWVTR